jgi:hypothetical protein
MMDRPAPPGRAHDHHYASAPTPHFDHCQPPPAFSAVAATEVVFAKKNFRHDLSRQKHGRWLSPQFILDCASPNDNDGTPLVRGCFGSSLFTEAPAIIKETGIPFDADYRYRAITTAGCPLTTGANLTMVKPLRGAYLIDTSRNITVQHMMHAVAKHGAITAALVGQGVNFARLTRTAAGSPQSSTAPPADHPPPY